MLLTTPAAGLYSKERHPLHTLKFPNFVGKWKP
jgi:hypothetical protein